MEGLEWNPIIGEWELQNKNLKIEANKINVKFFEFSLFNLQFICYNDTSGVWRSLVARSAGGREVAGSNPVTPTYMIP